MGPGGIARRAAVALSALLLAVSPWIIQTSLPRGSRRSKHRCACPANRAKAQTESIRTDQAARAFAALPKGQAYGPTTHSRVTLRVHRPTRASVHSREAPVFSRRVQPGDAIAPRASRT